VSVIFDIILNGVHYDVQCPTALLIGDNTVAPYASSLIQALLNINKPVSIGSDGNYTLVIQAIDITITAPCSAYIYSHEIYTNIKDGAISDGAFFGTYCIMAYRSTATQNRLTNAVLRNRMFTGAGRIAYMCGVEYTVTATAGGTEKNIGYYYRPASCNAAVMDYTCAIALRPPPGINVADIILSIGESATIPVLPGGKWSIFDNTLHSSVFFGPITCLAVGKEDDFAEISWAAAGTAGVKWTQRLSAGPGTIALVSPAKGGIVNIRSLAATDPTILYENDMLTVSLGDRPLMYTRFASVEVANTRKFVGYSNAYDTAENLPYDTGGGTGQAMGIMVDTAVGNFFYSVGVRAGAVTLRQIAALDANYHRFKMVPSYNSAGAFDGYNVWMDGVLVTGAKLLDAELPLEATMMQRIPGFATNLAAAADSNLRVDTFKDGERRFTGAGAT